MNSKQTIKPDAVKGLYARCLVEEIDHVNKTGVVAALARRYESVPPDFVTEERTAQPRTRR